MQIQEDKVLIMLDDDGNLKAIVWYDMKKRSQVIYNVSESGRDEIMELLK